MEDIVGMVLVFGGATIVAFSISPIGRAIADRIRGSTQGAPGKALEELRDSHMAMLDEIDQLRQELAEVNERVDFTERILADRQQGELPSPSESQE